MVSGKNTLLRLKRESMRSEAPEDSAPVLERSRERQDHILAAAARVFAQKSYGLASMRDIAREARLPLSLLYYYVKSKQEMLHLISARAFDSLYTSLQKRLVEIADPHERLLLLVHSHISYHMANLDEMKVLVREADSLTGRYTREIFRKKREYSKVCMGILSEVAAVHGFSPSTAELRVCTSALFGMMNWSYVWYNPEKDKDVTALAEAMSHLFIHGFLGTGVLGRKGKRYA